MDDARCERDWREWIDSIGYPLSTVRQALSAEEFARVMFRAGFSSGEVSGMQRTLEGLTRTLEGLTLAIPAKNEGSPS